MYDNWTVSVQREVRKRLTVELDYNGVYGSHLQAGLLNPNQVPMSVVNDLIARFGPAQTRRPAELANHLGGGGRRRHQGSLSELHQSRRADAPGRVAQALRPYPQYLAVNVQSGGGDKTGRSHYHAGVVKVNQRLTGGCRFRGATRTRRLMTDADSFSGSGGAMDAAHPELEWSIGRFDQPHTIKINPSTSCRSAKAAAGSRQASPIRCSAAGGSR